MKIAYIEDDKGRHDIRSAEGNYTPIEGDIIVDVEREEDIPKAYRVASYVEMRAPEYPPMADYLDAVAKGDTVAIEVYKQKCLAVKAKYPKGQTYKIFSNPN